MRTAAGARRGRNSRAARSGRFKARRFYQGVLRPAHRGVRRAVFRRRNVRGLLIAGAIALVLLLYAFFPVGRPNLRAPRSSLPPIPLDDARFLIVGLTQ